jgi:RecA/RadA recombinase
MSTPPGEKRAGFITADKLVRARVEMGIRHIDVMLGGGLEAGIMHLFYGDRCLHEDLLRFAVKAQMASEKGGLASPVIIIDSANVIKIDRLANYALEMEEEPEKVLDRIYISRAFNSSQTYDLIMHQIDDFFSRIPARTLLVTGLPELYLQEGIDGQGLQEIGHMASKLKNLTIRRELITLVSTPSAEGRLTTPAGGNALASAAQVHIMVEEHKSYVMYTLAKHPQYPVRRVKKTKEVSPGGNMSLGYFLKGGEEGEE